MFDSHRYNVAWQAETTGTRACAICDHVGADGKTCNRFKQTTEHARRQGGACGIEAVHLSFPGLELPVPSWRR